MDLIMSTSSPVLQKAYRCTYDVPEIADSDTSKAALVVTLNDPNLAFGEGFVRMPGKLIILDTEKMLIDKCLVRPQDHKILSHGVDAKLYNGYGDTLRIEYNYYNPKGLKLVQDNEYEFLGAVRIRFSQRLDEVLSRI